MGLLDQMDDPRTMGLLSLGLGMLNSKGGNALTALGQAGPGALDAMRQVKLDQQRKEQMKQQQAMQAMQMQQAQMQIAEAQRAQQAQQRRGSYLDSINPAAGPAMPFNPAAALGAGLKPDEVEMLGTKANKPLIVGGNVIDPVTFKPLWSEPQKPESKPEIVKVLETLHGPGTPAFMDALRQYQVKATTHAPAASTNVSVGGPVFEKEYSKDQGKQFSEVMAGINKSAFAAPAQIRKLERMQALLDGVDGGKLAPVGLEVASWANSVGIKMDPKLGNKEAAQALSRDIAGGFRQPGTGPMTDKDFENFLLQVPDLSKTAEGRKQITATMKAAAARDIQIAKIARDYERKNGRLDNGFLDEASQYIAENPVIGMPSGWKVR